LGLKAVEVNGINFISFTPGTTFDLRSRGGKVEERALIYQMLHGHFGIRSTPLLNLLQATVVSRERWISGPCPLPEDHIDSAEGQAMRITRLIGNAITGKTRRAVWRLRRNQRGLSLPKS
jgi:hypothetical protein